MVRSVKIEPFLFGGFRNNAYLCSIKQLKQVNMITHKDLESNCKRIAKYIKINSIEPSVVLTEKITLMVSRALAVDFHNNKKAYCKKINQQLKGGKVIDGNICTSGVWWIEFRLKFDD